MVTNLSIIFINLPSIASKYTRNVASKVFNYNWAIFAVCLSNDSTCLLSCHCVSLSFLYGPHGHTIAGNISIEENTELRNIHLNVLNTWNLNKSTGSKIIYKHAKQWSKNEDMASCALHE
jgi:hypothetical protein